MTHYPTVTRFDNGYEASVVNDGYGSDDGLLEVGAFVTATGQSVSTKGWLSGEQAAAEVARIGALPRYETPAAPQAVTSPLSPEREAEIRARAEDGRGLRVWDARDLLAALDHERAENQRLRDSLETLARKWIDMGVEFVSDITYVEDACAMELRAALAAPTPEETP